MGTPLKNPPVYFTVAQVRFNALLKLLDFLPSIQENMRRTGFPDFATHKSVAVQVVMQDGQPTPVTVPYERYVFGTVDQTHSFVLDPHALTLQSTNYGQFERFSASFLKGLALIHDVVHLDFTERIGLRYLDRVTPRDGEDLTLYLAPEVLGLSSRLEGKALHAYSETLTEVGAFKLLSRVVIQEGGLSFPPDILPAGMAFNGRFLTYVGRHAVLDNDGFSETREVFDLKLVEKKLFDIHDVIGSAFRAAVTPHAFTVWDEQ